MARIKAMERTAAAAADSDNFRPEMVEDEPRYLRRQKPVEIRRKKFGAKNWSLYRRVTVWVLISAAAIAVFAFAIRFALYNPQMLLLKPDQVELTGNHIVAREALVGIFHDDRGKSVLAIPLDKRRSEIEQIGWVESATVQRILPNRLRVEITERTPVAFARNGSEIVLVDAHGVLLDRPADGEFRFPIVSGVTDSLSREDREHRMQIFQDLMHALNSVHSGSADQVSEVDLSTPKNAKVVMAGIPGTNATQAITIRFGEGDFFSKYEKLVSNFSRWQAEMGCVRSIDMQFRFPVATPDPNGCEGQPSAKKSK